MDNCEGCNKNFCEIFRTAKFSKGCPCMECLIKPMCSNDCSKWTIFYLKANLDRLLTKYGLEERYD